MIVGVGDVSLIGVALDGVIGDRIACSIGMDETGDLALQGVLDVAVDGDCSILSNCSRREATPLPVGFGERGAGD